MTPIESYDDLMQTSQAFRQARIIMSAVETNLFTLIGKENLSAKQIAEKGELSLRATEIVLDALASMGLLIKDNGWFSVSELSAKYLAKGSESYIGATMLHRSKLWDNWSNLTVILHGEVTEWMRKRPGLTDPKLNRSFILCMHDLHYPDALRMCQFLDLEGVRHVVDLGGGAGSYSIAFVKFFHGLRATIIDLPQTLEVAKEVVGNFGLSERIECKEGDIYGDLMLPISGDVDLFFVSNIIHQEGYEENARLMKRIHKHLVPGGRVIINGTMLDESRTMPENGAIFSVNMLVNTERGRSYSKGEIERLLTDAGFETWFEHNLAFGRKE